MNMTKFYTDDMADQAMHDSGPRLVNTKDGVQLEIERNA